MAMSPEPKPDTDIDALILAARKAPPDNRRLTRRIYHEIIDAMDSKSPEQKTILKESSRGRLGIDTEPPD